MKLYILRPINGRPEWSPWYDKAFGFVIRAESEEAARDIASKNGGDETSEWDAKEGNPWLSPSASTCEVLLSKGEAGMVMRDFNAA